MKLESTIDDLINSLYQEKLNFRDISDKLDKTLNGRSSFFAQKIDDDTDLKNAIDQTLTGCWTVFLLLQKELRKWVPGQGKDPSFLQKAGLLFQDEIIQDYRVQIEGHIEGLKTVLVCLQA